MKIIVAYDGSVGAEAALQDMKRAGLPSSCEICVISAADVFVPHVSDGEEKSNEAFYETPSMRKAREVAARRLAEAHEEAETARARLQRRRSEWVVTAEAVADCADWAVIRRADEWGADLVIVGSRSQSGFETLLLGSVSQKVLNEARCAVRIGREPVRPVGEPCRILVGMDGSVGAEAAVEAVKARVWPEGTEVKLLAAMDGDVLVSNRDAGNETIRHFESGDEDGHQWAIDLLESQGASLRAPGLDVSVMTSEEKPVPALLEESASWNADCIFLGATGATGFAKFLLGSVSSSVAAKAHCSVEVVRVQSQNRE